MNKIKPMLDGRELSAAELEAIKEQIESLSTIEQISPSMYALIEQQWPELLSKIVPARSTSYAAV